MDIEEKYLGFEIPKVPKYCVYILLDHDSIIYIGTTQKGMTGIFNNKHINDKVNKILFIEAKNEIHMLQIQNNMIVKYRPKDNTCLNNLAHRVSTLKYKLEEIYYFNKSTVNKLIDNSGVDVIRIGCTDYLDDENYHILFTYASDFITDKYNNKELSPLMNNILNIMINNGGLLYRSKYGSFWFYDLETWNRLQDDYMKKTEWAEDYDLECLIDNQQILNELENSNGFCIPKSFWYTTFITSQLKALSNRKLISLDLLEGKCTLTNKKYFR